MVPALLVSMSGLSSWGLVSAGPLRADTGGAGRRGEAGNTYISSGGGMSLVQLQRLETTPGGQLSIWRGGICTREAGERREGGGVEK